MQLFKGVYNTHSFFDPLQALLQSGEAEESIPHFQQALRLLDTHLPSSKLGVLNDITSQALRQLLHIKFPRRFLEMQR